MKDMAKITYDTKEALNENADILDKYKCNASDLNEIKSVVNTNDDNSTANSESIGTLSNLSTTAKTDLVSAINELVDKLGTKGKSIKVGLSASQTGTADAISYFKFNVIRETDGTDYFELQSDGSVKVMSDYIDKVLIIASNQWTGTVGSTRIFKGTTQISLDSPGQYTATSLTSIVVKVSKGDVLRAGTYGNVTTTSWEVATYMAVVSL